MKQITAETPIRLGGSVYTLRQAVVEGRVRLGTEHHYLGNMRVQRFGQDKCMAYEISGPGEWEVSQRDYSKLLGHAPITVPPIKAP